MGTVLTTPFGTELVVDEPVDLFADVLRADPGAFGRWFEAHVAGEPRLVNVGLVFTVRPAPPAKATAKPVGATAKAKA